MEREEEAVRREVARRLVPPGLLRGFVAARIDIGGVTVDEVADEFDVEWEVAAKALDLLDLLGPPVRRPRRTPG